jgi:hypothetical protein
MLLACALSAAHSGLGQALTDFQNPGEVYTNAIGILRRTTIYPPDSENRELPGGTRIVLRWNYELYPLPGQAETNRVMTLAGRDRHVNDELRLLVGERVKVEGRLIERFMLNEKGERYRYLFHLVITNVMVHEPKPRTNLDSQQAHLLAKRLVASYYDFFSDAALQRSAPPQFRSGRWVWVCRQGSGHSDVEATVTFAEDGSSPEFDWKCLTSEVYVPR